MQVILWDIDGTLVRSNGGRIAVNAFLRALALSCAQEGRAALPRGFVGQD